MLKNILLWVQFQRHQLWENRKAVMANVISTVLWLGFAVSIYLLYTT